MTFNIPTASYLQQNEQWPKQGRHILACFDEQSVIVYQAYRPSIGQFAIEHGFLGGPDFSLSRMSWIKPNFLWMMYRSGWATKAGQETILALRIRRTFFDTLLDQAVASSFDPQSFDEQEQWQHAVSQSEVRLQWDPDHCPTGTKLDRRALQLGLRGNALAAFTQRELLEVIDMTGFTAMQRQHIHQEQRQQLQTPHERVYLPACPLLRKKLALDTA
jgi:Domain of unknown function (DUF4291)